MTTDQIDALEALLAQTEAAHGTYETTELNGVYDQDWPAWYAGYAVQNGIGELLGRAVTADELARFFDSSWRELQQADPEATEPWAVHTARLIATEL